MAPRYHLTTSVHLQAARGQVWATLADIGAWPTWWRWARRIDVLQSPGPDGVGGVYRTTIATRLGYGFTYAAEVVEVEAPRMILAHSTGDLEGWGLFLLHEASTGTHVDFTWLVETHRRWMNAVAPMARPLFVWNHDRLMQDFGRGLARAAGGALRGVENSSLPPGRPEFFQLPDRAG